MTVTRDAGAAASTRLIQALVDADVTTVRSLFSGPADIDDPFAGHHVDGGFEALVRNWAPAHLAAVTSIELTHCTCAGNGCGAEITVHLDRNGTPVDLPVVVVSDFDESGAMVRSRFYYRRAWVDGRQHHRWPIIETPRPTRFNPTLAAYQRALHDGDVEGMLATFGPDPEFDGHGQSKNLDDGLGMGHYEGRAELEGVLRQMFGIMGKGANLEYLNVIDDGTTTVLEFNLHQGVPEDPQVRAHAGVAAYELGEDGLIKSARIYDEAW